MEGIHIGPPCRLRRAARKSRELEPFRRFLWSSHRVCCQRFGVGFLLGCDAHHRPNSPLRTPFGGARRSERPARTATNKPAWSLAFAAPLDRIGLGVRWHGLVVARRFRLGLRLIVASSGPRPAPLPPSESSGVGGLK